MERREAPQTDEGWYALHDFRTVDWDAWREAPVRRRERAVSEGVDYLRRHVAVEDSEAGDSAVFSVLGHKADLLVLHLRPSLADIDAAQRRLEGTALGEFTDRSSSYVSVTEISGYMSEEYFAAEAADTEERLEAVEDTGTARYIRSRLEPTIPDADHVSFYPMSKRRDPEYNWYDLPFEDRAELMAGHGDIGREYGGRVTQIITGSMGFDDWEWGVTLFGDDPTEIKHLLAEMRFDPSTSRYAEFGSFYVGRRFPPEDLGALLAGRAVPTDGSGSEGEAAAHAGAPGHAPAASNGGAGSAHAHGEGGGSGSAHGEDGGGGHAHAEGGAGGAGIHETDEADEDGAAAIREELADLDIYAGQPHGEDVYAMTLYSEADPEDLADKVDGLRSNFEHYDTHVKTTVYEDPDGGESAVVSLWETQRAAETAGGFLADLPGVVGGPEDEEGFGTMGMFYTTKPEHREDFVEKFEAVGDQLEEMAGHRETALLVNRGDENDMFIASRWRSKDDAMEFFRSEEFASTVSWGKDVLADRPRHVFLA